MSDMECNMKRRSFQISFSTLLFSFRLRRRTSFLSRSSSASSVSVKRNVFTAKYFSSSVFGYGSCLYQSMLFTIGYAVINLWIIHKPSEFALCRQMTDRTSGAGHLAVFHDSLSCSKFSGYIFVMIRIGNMYFVFFLLWILVNIQ